MTTFPYFKTRFHEDTPANLANPAKEPSKISNFSNFSGNTPDKSDFHAPIEVIEERAAIMEFDAPDMYSNRMSAAERANQALWRNASFSESA